MSEENKCTINCPYESIVKELQRDSQRNSDQHREFYKKFNETDTSIAISTERYNNLLTTMAELKVGLNEVKSAISDLNEKPAKKWDTISTYVITTIVGGVLGAILSNLI